MFPRSTTLTLLVPALLLGACSGTKNRGVESVHQPVVNRTDYVFDAQGSGYGLDRSELERVSGWMASLRPGYGDRVYVEDAAGGGARDQIAAEAARYGLLVSDQAPITGTAPAPGAVRVVVSRVRAGVPGCPDFSRNDQPEFNSNTSSNYGCASNANLAAMIANPEDLVQGRSASDGGDPNTAYKAVGTHRRALPTGNGGIVPNEGGAGATSGGR